jgi:general secretion pathway protein M
LRALSLLSSFWQPLAPRQRAAVVVAALVVCVGLVWGLLLSPALATLRQAEQQRADLAVQAQQMQRLAQQAEALRALPQIKAADALHALQTTTQEQLGDAAKLTAQGDRASVTLTRVGAAQLAAWLAQARANARASVLEMRLTRDTATTAADTGAANASANPNTRAAHAAGAPGASTTWSGTLSLSLPPP